MEEISNKKRVPIKKVIPIIIFMTIVFGTYAYLYIIHDRVENKEAQNHGYNTSTSEIETSNPSTNTTNTDNEVAATEESSVLSDWKTYKNTKYGFSLTFNDLWKNYRIIERKPDSERDGAAIISNVAAYLYVCVPTISDTWSDEASGVYCPFAITAIKAANYEKYAAEDPLVGHYINRNSSYAFTYNKAQGRPENDGEAVISDSDNIISTFKLIQ